MTNPMGPHVEFQGEKNTRIGMAQLYKKNNSIKCNQKKSIFIAFEGVPGSGKSTQAEIISKWIVSKYKKKVSITRAFGELEKSTIEEFKRKLNINESSISMMFLFQSLHSRHFDLTISALEESDVVIADCWRYPFIAFHSLYGDLAKLDPTFITMLDALAYRNFTPDLTFHFCLDPKIAYSRYVKREANLRSPIRQETAFSLQEMSNLYFQASKSEGWTQIEAGASPSSRVTKQIKSCLTEYFSSCSS